jgi:hypothetical protein
VLLCTVFLPSPTQTYCGGSRTIGGPKPPVKVSLKQCQNIAYGTCQTKAKDTAMKGACMTAFNGFNQCNRQQVRGQARLAVYC